MDKYYVTFYAYAPEFQLFGDKTPGHVMIAFGKEDHTTGSSISDGIWGFYPKENYVVQSILDQYFPVFNTGLIKSDHNNWLNRNLIEARLSIEVSRKKYEKALGVIAKWKSNQDYYLLSHSCIHFAQEIAEAIDLSLPSNISYVFPSGFLQELVELNN
jgi:hypothetical protein